MPPTKTNLELNRLHRKNTLKQPKSGYNALCDAAKALRDDSFRDTAFNDLEIIFHVSTFTNGRDSRFADQKDLQLQMRAMIYELTRESNEAEKDLEKSLEVYSPSIEIEKGSVNGKYDEIKNYFTAIKTQAEEYISSHPEDQIGNVGKKIKQDRIDTAKSMQEYAEAMLYNIDLKLQMRKDEETVLKKLKDLKQHPENLSATLDEIIEIESAYPAESRIHNAIEKICHDNLKIDPAADPSDREKYYNIGRPVNIFWETVTDEYEPNVYSLNSASYIPNASIASYNSGIIRTQKTVSKTAFDYAESKKALKEIEKSIPKSANIATAQEKFNNALTIARDGIDEGYKNGMMEQMRNIYTAARLSKFGKAFGNNTERRLQSDSTLHYYTVVMGGIELLEKASRAMQKSAPTPEQARIFTEVFLETLERGNRDLLAASGSQTRLRISDRVSRLYHLGAKLLGDGFKNSVDDAIERTNWGKDLMRYMASDMYTPLRYGEFDKDADYNDRMKTAFELFSKHNPGIDVCEDLAKAYNAMDSKIDGIEELVENGKSLDLKGAIFTETRPLYSASFDTEETRSLKSNLTTKFNKDESLKVLEEIEKTIPKSEDARVAIVRFNKALTIASGGLNTGSRDELLKQMRKIYVAARQTDFGKAFSQDINARLSDSNIYSRIVIQGGLAILDKISQAVKKSGPTPEQTKVFTEVFLETLENGNEYLLGAASRQSQPRLSDRISKLYHFGAAFLGDDFIKSVDQAVENTQWGKDLMKYMASDLNMPLHYSKFKKDAEYGDRIKTAVGLFLKHDPEKADCDKLLDAYAAEGTVIDGFENLVVEDKSAELKKAMFNRLAEELNTFKKAESAEAAMASYNRLQQMNLRTGGAFTAMQGIIKKAYDNAVEKFGVEITHYEDRTHMQDEVNDDYVQEFKDFSKEVRNAKSAFNNSTEYNVFSSTTDAYVSLVEEINRAKKAGEDHININNLSSNAGKMAKGILHSENISMEDAGKLMTKFSSSIMEAARNYEKYKMADHTLDPENEPDKKLLNKDDLRKMNLTHQILGKPNMPKDPKDLYKQKDAQKDAKAQEQSILM